MKLERKNGASFRVGSGGPKIEDGGHKEKSGFVDGIDLRNIARKVIDNAVRKILKNDDSGLSGLANIRDRLKGDKEVLDLFNNFIRLGCGSSKRNP